MGVAKETEVNPLASHAYIKLVSASKQKNITLDEIKALLKYYKEITAKTGQQLGWHYGLAAFPYQFAETKEGKGEWFYLESTDPDHYRYIVFSVDQEKDTGQSFIQVTLPDDATHGDKNKANEFCKFISKKLKGELHLFNQRVMVDYENGTAK